MGLRFCFWISILDELGIELVWFVDIYIYFFLNFLNNISESSIVFDV